MAYLQTNKKIHICTIMWCKQWKRKKKNCIWILTARSIRKLKNEFKKIRLKITLKFKLKITFKNTLKITWVVDRSLRHSNNFSTKIFGGIPFFSFLFSSFSVTFGPKLHCQRTDTTLWSFSFNISVWNASIK